MIASSIFLIRFAFIICDRFLYICNDFNYFGDDFNQVCNYLVLCKISARRRLSFTRYYTFVRIRFYSRPARRQTSFCVLFALSDDEMTIYRINDNNLYLGRYGFKDFAHSFITLSTATRRYRTAYRWCWSALRALFYSLCGFVFFFFSVLREHFYIWFVV